MFSPQSGGSIFGANTATTGTTNNIFGLSN
jgi:hypothetical protein